MDHTETGKGQEECLESGAALVFKPERCVPVPSPAGLAVNWKDHRDRGHARNSLCSFIHSLIHSSSPCQFPKPSPALCQAADLRDTDSEPALQS